MEQEKITLVQSVEELVGIFEFYLLKYPQDVVANVEKHLEKMGKDKAVRWMASRIESLGLPISDGLRNSIFQNFEDSSIKERRFNNLGSTSESELRKYLARKDASLRRYKNNF